MSDRNDSSGHEDLRKIGSLERHVQTLALSLIVILTVWVVSTISITQRDVAVMNVRLLQVGKKLDSLPAVNSRLTDHEIRILRLEDKHRKPAISD